jgi:hypothetical protein
VVQGIKLIYHSVLNPNIVDKRMKITLTANKGDFTFVHLYPKLAYLLAYLS